MTSKDIFRALQNGDLNFAHAEKELQKIMTGLTQQKNARERRKLTEPVIDNSISQPNALKTNLVVDMQTITPGVIQVCMQDRIHKNTFSEELAAELICAFETIANDTTCKVVILTGYDNYFASGGTKEGLLAIYEGKVKFTDVNLYSLALDCKIPVIAAMQGHAIGAGWAMGMFSDFIVFCRESFYSSNYIKYGFTPGAGATLIFPEKLGINLAQEILYTGKQFRGSELEKKGIPFPVLSRSEVLPYAIQLANNLAEAPRDALISLKQLMAAPIRNRLQATFESELKMHEKTFVRQPEVKKRIESLFNNIPRSAEQNKQKETVVKKDLSTTKVDRNYKPQPEMRMGQSGKWAEDSIAIIGMSGQFPGAGSLKEYWANLACGKNCISEIPPTRWPLADFYDKDPKAPGKSYSKWMGSLDDIDKFDPLFFNISPAEAELMDPQQRLFLQNCWHCIEDAGIKASSLSGSRCGVFVGCTNGDYWHFLNTRGLNAQGFLGAVTSILSARISYLLNLKGPCLAIDTACSSSLTAISEACNSLVLGNSDIALAGGVCVMVGPLMHIMTSKSGMLSKDGRCYTFDGRANGFVPGEGVGVIMLKRLQDAVRDGDRIHGVIRGWGVNQDGKTNGITAPNSLSQAALLKDVYKRFKIDPKTITLIEAHGTGTKLGDPIEVEGLLTAFEPSRDQKPFCALGAVKSNIGHLLAAAGIAGVIKVLLALKHKMLPPTINFETLNEHIVLENSPFYINTKLSPWEVPAGQKRRAGVSGFGFSGTNVHLVIDEYLPPESKRMKPISSKNRTPETFILSARNKEQLLQSAHCLTEWVQSNPTLSLPAIAYTLQVGRESMEYRTAFLANTIEELSEKLKTLSTAASSSGAPIFQVKTLTEDKEDFCPDKPAQLYAENISNRERFQLATDLWLSGYEFDWNILYTNQKPERISLPLYPFAAERYWLAHIEAGKCPAPVIPIITEHQDQAKDCTLPEISPQQNLLDFDLRQTFMISFLISLLSKVLKIAPDRFDPETGFDEVGLDSFGIQQLNEELEKHFGVISTTLFFTYKSIHALSQYFMKEYKEEVTVLIESRKAGNEPVKKSELKISASAVNSTEEQKRAVVTQGKGKNCEDDAIAIIGISGQYPGAANIDQFWENLVQGRDCIVEIPQERWDYRLYYTPEEGGKKKAGGMYCKWGGFLDDVDKFDPSYFNISPLEARFMDPQERLFIQTVAACFQDAGYCSQRLIDKNAGDNRAAVGVFAGVTFNNYQLHVLKEFEKGNFAPVNSQIYSIANRISYLFNLRGPSLSVDTACSSSLYALHLACESIKQGECAMSIAGGVNLSLHPSKYMSLCVSHFAASDGRCHSFGEDGDGYVPGEGVGAVLLKPLHAAVQDKDHIYAVIKGTGVNNDGKTFGYSVPNPVAQTEVITDVLNKTQIAPRTISYIEAHGTGTKLGDPIEIEGLARAFNKYTADKQFCAIGSVKSNIGHLEAAAGIAQLTKVILQMKHKKLVPTVRHSSRLNQAIDFEKTPFFVQQSVSDWQQPEIKIDGQATHCPRRAGISSFGAGGVNVHAIIEEYSPSPECKQADNGKQPLLIVLSAKKAEDLRNTALLLKAYAWKMQQIENVIVTLDNIAYTLQTGRDHLTHRLAFSASNMEELITKLDAFLHEPNRIGTQSGFFTGIITSETSKIDEIVSDKFAEKFYSPVNITQLAKNWVNGLSVNWEQLYSQESLPWRIPLPTYPFSKKRYWVGEDGNTQELVESEVIKPLQSVSQKSNILTELAEAMQDERLELIQNFVRTIIIETLGFGPSDAPDMQQGFFDMGMESVMIENFQTKLINLLNIEISETAVFDYPNIKELSGYLLTQLLPVLDETNEQVQEKTAVMNEVIDNTFTAHSNDQQDLDEMSLDELATELRMLLE